MQEGICLTLNPDFKLLEVAYPIMACPKRPIIVSKETIIVSTETYSPKSSTY